MEVNREHRDSPFQWPCPGADTCPGQAWCCNGAGQTRQEGVAGGCVRHLIPISVSENRDKAE